MPFKANNIVKIHTETFTAESAITKYKPVFANSTNKDHVEHTANANQADPVGIPLASVSAGEEVEVLMIGICPVIATSAVAYGNKLISAVTNGYAAPAASDSVDEASASAQNVFGKARTAASADGDWVSAYINTFDMGMNFGA